jgi:hypothetical protein
MAQIINVYCDESCHLEHDGKPIMTLGAIWCPLEKSREIAARLRDIKRKHGIKTDYEIKWERVSPGKLQFYLDLVDYFFDDDHLHFRAYVADKQGLKHDEFGQTHDDWYFKMYFYLLSFLFDPEYVYRVYLDIKDTRSAIKIAKLHEVLCNNMYDFDRQIVSRVQAVNSKEVVQVQLVDLLIGAVGYANRNLTSSAAKLAIVERIRLRSRCVLTSSTLVRARKLNIFRWHPQEQR